MISIGINHNLILCIISRCVDQYCWKPRWCTPKGQQTERPGIAAINKKERYILTRALVNHLNLTISFIEKHPKTIY